MMPITVEYGSGDPINATQFYSVNIAWTRKLLCPINPAHYGLKRGRFPLKLYLNIIKSGELGLTF